MNPLLRRILWPALLGVLVACAVYVNTMTRTSFRVEGHSLYVSGVLTTNTHEKFKEVMADNPGITRLVLDYIEGSSDDDANFPLYADVRARGLETYLKANSEVYSGGVDLFVAGKTRLMEQGAKIGVHSWSDGTKDAAEYPRTSPEHTKYRSYVQAMLGTDDWYWFTIYAAPAEGMHVMTDAEIEQYGLLTSPVIEN